MRDLRLDELSKIAGTRVIAQPNGAVSVTIGNSMLVEGDTAVPVSVQLERPSTTPTIPPTPPVIDVPVRIRLGTSPDRLAPLAGELSAMVTVLNTDLPGTRTRLDAMASDLVRAVNTAHRGGYVFSGSTIPGTAAGDFFDTTAPVSAASIRLHASIADNALNIAASGDSSGPTDNSVAQALSRLRGTENTVEWPQNRPPTEPPQETGSFLGFFRGLVTRLGIQTASATDDAAVADNLTDQANLRRQSVSGVSTDEELVNMLRVQQSYQAATKMIKVAEEMLDTLISLV
jgi:flagellar hook-associated protein 1 FlgK